MKVNPITREVFTDSGTFIKKLHCPYRINWALIDRLDDKQRLCSVCDRPVLDTATIQDEELLAKVQEDPSTCLTIDLNQSNVIVISNGISI